jgi:hypothetical protein
VAYSQIWLKLSSPNFISSHGNISFLQNKKEEAEEIRRELVWGREGSSTYLCILLRFGNTLGCPPPPSQEPPLQHKHYIPREKEQYDWEGMRAAGRAAGMAFCQMGIYLLFLK